MQRPQGGDMTTPAHDFKADRQKVEAIRTAEPFLNTVPLHPTKPCENFPFANNPETLDRNLPEAKTRYLRGVEDVGGDIDRGETVE